MDMLRAVVSRVKIVFGSITFDAKRLKVMNTIASRFGQGDNMISRKGFISAATKAFMVSKFAKGLPFLFCMMAWCLFFAASPDSPCGFFSSLDLGSGFVFFVIGWIVFLIVLSMIFSKVRTISILSSRPPIIPLSNFWALAVFFHVGAFSAALFLSLFWREAVKVTTVVSGYPDLDFRPLDIGGVPFFVGFGLSAFLLVFLISRAAAILFSPSDAFGAGFTFFVICTTSFYHVFSLTVICLPLFVLLGFAISTPLSLCTFFAELGKSIFASLTFIKLVGRLVLIAFRTMSGFHSLFLNGDLHWLAVLVSRQNPVSQWRPRKQKTASWVLLPRHMNFNINQKKCQVKGAVE